MEFSMKHINTTWNHSQSLTDSELWRTTYSPDNTTEPFAGLTYLACLGVSSGSVRMEISNAENGAFSLNVTSLNATETQEQENLKTHFGCLTMTLCDFGTLHIFLENVNANMNTTSQYDLTVNRTYDGFCPSGIPRTYSEIQIILVCLWVG